MPTLLLWIPQCTPRSDSHICVDGQEEGVSILVPDSGHQGDSPKLSPRAYVPGEDSYLGYTDLGCR